MSGHKEYQKLTKLVTKLTTTLEKAQEQLDDITSHIEESQEYYVKGDKEEED